MVTLARKIRLLSSTNSRPAFKKCFSSSNLQDWIERIKTKRQVYEDEASASPITDLNLTLDRDDPRPKEGDVVPPTYHLTYFHSLFKERDLSPDGYDATFAPPEPYIQRMWAGASVHFDTKNPLRVGQKIRQETTAPNTEVKQGSRGETIFVTLKKDIFNSAGLSVRDSWTLAYMTEKPDLSKQKMITAKPHQFQREIKPTPIMLFRYSALTHNCHKIHFDHEYVTKEEGYPALVVHGPLTSTLLMDVFRRQFPNKTVKSFSYRALSPLFADGSSFFVCGKLSEAEANTCEVWAKTNAGFLAMKGTVTFE
eukprot:TRINITY_DN8701_c0_g1_i1.p1 TRINITY_DN8701_c0_g1~~TRINITY_DN8701_c0_g1_i1.p1  ORF type:complete len:310 (-),score=44.87 TRINITY_DN8701_c0_g1_i1:3-932(-)